MPCPEKFRDSLTHFAVEQATIDAICGGYEGLVGHSPRKERAAFFQRALNVLDDRMQPEAVRDLLAWNACCKSGAREKASKEFARINGGKTLAEKLALIASRPYLNMGVPELTDQGEILLHAVSWSPDGERYACACTTFKGLKLDRPVSKHYCCCCGGHFQYHYQIMLGVKLTVAEVVSSPLDSMGAQPCVFRLRVEA